MKPFLFKDPILPERFNFPTEYEQIAYGGTWPDIEPWHFLANNMPLSLSFYGEMLLKFPNTPLIPFAFISDPSGLYNDGFVVLACFDGSDNSESPRVRIYDFGTPKKSPWDNLNYINFDAWLDFAKKESIQFKADRDED